MAAPSDYYQILGVSPDAPLRIIRRAYRLIALRSHPDTNPGDETAAERFRLATEAYDILSDAARRALYDAQRRGEITTDDPFESPYPPAGFAGSAHQADVAWDHIRNLEAMWERAQRRQRAATEAALAREKEQQDPAATPMQFFLFGLCLGALAVLASLMGVLFFW
jgi:curved DNA-binding protein CbpA